jgi:hypothetical protein
MRYLNKVIFINSATVKFAEINIDGNVHFTGTQGVGKSVLLRAILFFYNADKTKLGIPREKKRFDEYYFEYQNSYIIYEVMRDNNPFCVLAYKVNGRVAFRFFNSAFRKELFIDKEGRALDNWDKIRAVFGKDIYYTKTISNYEEYRQIIYGDNKGMKPEYRKYAIIESKQFQNIPRTIQNVLLNSKLEAQFIKDTIINSINEEEIKIDLENYSKNHLRGFETQLNDIKLWFKTNKKGQNPIQNQANNVIDNYRRVNFAKKEKNKLAENLSGRINYIENEKPKLISEYKKDNEKLSSIIKQLENQDSLYRKREQKLISDINLFKNKLNEAKQKQGDYTNKNITEILEKVSHKSDLLAEQNNKEKEKNLLTTEFADINQKYESLIAEANNEHERFSNTKDAEINNIKIDFSESKNKIIENYRNIFDEIKESNQEQINTLNTEKDNLKDQENELKRKKAELKYKVFYSDEIEKCKNKTIELNKKISDFNTEKKNAGNEIKTLRKEWEINEKEAITNFNNLIKEQEKLKDNYKSEINKIDNKIQSSKSSLYGWLSENVSNWEENIGKIIDDEVLFNSELNPQFTKQTNTIFGLEINLNALQSKVKTVKQYQAEINSFENKIIEIDKYISEITQQKEKDLKNLRIKFRKKINDLSDVVAENEYGINQTEEAQKRNNLELDEWLAKSRKEKTEINNKVEEHLEKLTVKKQKNTDDISRLNNSIKAKITKATNQQNNEIYKQEQISNKLIEQLQKQITENKAEISKRIEELKKQQYAELNNKGVNTKRINEIEKRLNEIKQKLQFIEENQRIVFEYEKDKRELFDKIPEFNTEKQKLEKRLSALENEHLAEKEKLNKKKEAQSKLVEKLQNKIDEFEKDLIAFQEFEKTEVFEDILSYFVDTKFSEIAEHTAIQLISNIKDKHYSIRERIDELKQSVNKFVGNFNENNIFNFKVIFNSNNEYFDFAIDLKEFIEEDKISEFEKRINERFVDIIQLIGRETTNLQSKEAEIEKVIKKINQDFAQRNFVTAIKGMEMRTQPSSNRVVQILIQIKDFNDKYGLELGERDLFTTENTDKKNERAVELLKQLVTELERYKNTTLSLSSSFDLQFKIVENNNNSGWVENLSNVGSEGTDVLVKAMINILLLNVFKESASKKFKDFKLHCMMDEIGKLHPNNVKGILRFANDRNILLINSSPTSYNATNYRYTYILSKVKAGTNSYATKIKRLIKANKNIIDE